MASLYKQQGNEWILDLDDDPAPPPQETERLREFRENNIAAQRRIKELEEQMTRLAPESNKAKSLEEQVAQINRTLQDERAARDAAEKRARAESFKSSFSGATNTHKVRDDAAARALFAIAQSTYKPQEDGSFVPYEGEKIVYSRQRGKETEPMAVDEWVQTQREGSFKDLFVQAQGGGARGSSVTGGAPAARLSLTRTEAAKPNPEQFAAMQKGLVDIVE